jgi:hypothetical protein
MLATYRYAFNTDYIKAVISHQYAQVPLLLKLPVQFGSIGMITGLALVLAFDAPLMNRVLVAILFACSLTAVGVLSVKAGLLSRFRSKAEYGTEVSTSISHDGLIVDGRHFKAHLTWDLYPKAVRFHDGILLQKPGAVRWLPDAAIVEGTANDATQIVDRRTALRHVA